MHVLARSLRPLAYFLQEPENPVKRPRLTAVQNSDEAAGTDPGIFVGGGGGSNYPNIFDKQRSRERERERNRGFSLFFPSFPSAEVWFKSTSKFIFGREWFFLYN